MRGLAILGLLVTAPVSVHAECAGSSLCLAASAQQGDAPSPMPPIPFFTARVGVPLGWSLMSKRRSRDSAGV